jgi:hypothetical protein
MQALEYRPAPSVEHAVSLQHVAGVERDPLQLAVAPADLGRLRPVIVLIEPE